MRPETPADRTAIATLLAKTYGAAGAQIIATVSALRAKQSYRPHLSLVHETDGQLTGFALFTPLSAQSVYLAPLALTPEQQPDAFFAAAVAHLKAHDIGYLFIHGQQSDMAPLGFTLAANHGFHDTTPNTEGSDLLVHIITDLGLSGDITLPEALR